MRGEAEDRKLDESRAELSGLSSARGSAGSALLRDDVAPTRTLPSFGLFASLLLTGALGLGGFCGSCFFAILGILIYNHSGNHAGARTLDFADSYRYVALPVGVAALVVSGVVLLGLWARRQVRG